MATKPSIPKGTRDFGPQEMLRRKYIFNTIEKVFQKYGFLPLETPAMENLETLTGKYGEEGDRLIFKVQKRGNSLVDAVFYSVLRRWNTAGCEAWVGQPLTNRDDEAKCVNQHIDVQGWMKDAEREYSDLGMRYDLTVPFARYVVQNQNELAFPFKRYQIQPVWRADRPQKGRYREFYQCDADMIGSTSLLNEVDLIGVFVDVFDALKLRVNIKVNSRKVLAGMAEVLGVSDKLVDFTIVLDKLEKIGQEGFEREARERGISDGAIQKLSALNQSLVQYGEQYASKKLDTMAQLLSDSSIGSEGVAELRFMFSQSWDSQFGIQYHTLEFDHTLARGLDYYTGAIFEVKALEGTLQSSICGGGRYDDLTGVFGLKGMSGVGISFGADRIYDVLLETNKFPADLGASTKLMFANFGEKEAMHCLRLLRQVREAGIAAELFPDAVKLPKQFTYAEKKAIPYVAIVGETEMKENKVTLKRMGAGEKGELLSLEQVIERINNG